ncbi:hypothetical protein AB7W11_16300 [Providencia manganoxydans]|uniref:hypothetical protein n=1 Tax=Providencia manganoxydans TaxID=2923283 RepID=UPI0034E5CD97
MKLVIKNQRLILSLCLLMLTIYLSGCSNHPIVRQNNNNTFQLVGHIYSKAIDIPSESIITLSLTSMLTEGDIKPHNLDYKFINQKTRRTAEFEIKVPKNFYETTEQLGISARVEKNNELLMMSDKIIPLSKKRSDNIVLTVFPN